jgi:hypothetical protein
MQEPTGLDLEAQGGERRVMSLGLGIVLDQGGLLLQGVLHDLDGPPAQGSAPLGKLDG